jgi:hypothetical protein
MSQLYTLIWLRWVTFRNSLRSKKAVAGHLASALSMSAMLVLAILVAMGLGIAAYTMSSAHHELHSQIGLAVDREASIITLDAALFMMFAFIYMVWATLPLTLGTAGQFDPSRLLIYPIGLSKLFAFDFLSELTSMSSIFAVPAVFAVGLGVGLARGKVVAALLITLAASFVGLSLAKWLALTIGSLARKRKTRGEMILALVGAVVGLLGAFMGQLIPVAVHHVRTVRALRWTPPGAAAAALTQGLSAGGFSLYATSLLVLLAYGVLLVFGSYWLARRSALGKGGGKRRLATDKARRETGGYSGWELPLLPAELTAIIEKELRYAVRNAQLRVMAVMPLLLIGLRWLNAGRAGGQHEMPSGAANFLRGFQYYGEGLIATVGVLYVFAILSGLMCNQFSLEEGGMRTLMLAPIERRLILIGKNMAVTFVAALFGTGLLLVNQLVFADLTARGLLFVVFSFILFAALFNPVGNWFSMRFPKRMKFGKNMNVSGVAGLLLLPLLILLASFPLAAVLVGYLSRSLAIEYATLALLSGLALAGYALVITKQGRTLERQQFNILQVVNERSDS